VTQFWGDDAAAEAEREFDRVHVAREPPEDIPFVDWPASAPEVHLPSLLRSAFGVSTSEARRALEQGGVRLDGQRIANGSLDLPLDQVAGKVLQLGKRRFARVRVN
jgi:tyrosyl-tRNA synthetase